jgi:hypothetical protein
VAPNLKGINIMSTISNIHTAIVYDAKHTKPQNEQRLIVTIAKADKNGNYGQHLQQTMATSVPTLSIGDIDFNRSDVKSACVDYFKTIQNAIVAERIKSGKNTVTTEEISETAIIEYLNSETVGDKWDSDRIAAWFDSTIAEYVGVALIEKGYDDSKVESALVAYSKLISETLGSKGVIARKKAEAIDKAFKLVPPANQDATYTRFQARLNKVLVESNLDELLGL